MYTADVQDFLEIDDEVVSTAAAGNPDVRNRLLTALTPQLRLMVTTRLSGELGGCDSVEDIVQNVLFNLTSNLHTLQNRTVAGLRAFVSTIVTRRVADRLRRRTGQNKARAHVSLEQTIAAAIASDGGNVCELLSASGTSPSSAAQRAEHVSLVLTKLRELSPRHREAITLAFFDRLDTGQIAALMNLSRPAAAMMLLRAVEALRRVLVETSRSS